MAESRSVCSSKPSKRLSIAKRLTEKDESNATWQRIRIVDCQNCDFQPITQLQWGQLCCVVLLQFCHVMERTFWLV